MKNKVFYFILFLILSESCYQVNCDILPTVLDTDSTLNLIKSSWQEFQKQGSKSRINKEKARAGNKNKSQHLFSFYMTTQEQMVVKVFIGPRVQEILQNLFNILSADNFSQEELKQWAYDQGLNLVGMTAGALASLKLCSLLSITHPILKTAAMISLVYLGDKTVDFLKKTMEGEKELTEEDEKIIFDSDEELATLIKVFIKDHLAEITYAFITEMM